MGTIETTYDLPNDLTVAKAAGKMVADDIHEWTTNYYAGKITLLHLWDVLGADLSQISKEEIMEDARRTSKIASVRKGGKTAIVVPSGTLEYGITRMSQIFREMEEVPVEVQLFSDIETARQWLGIGGNHDNRV